MRPRPAITYREPQRRPGEAYFDWRDRCTSEHERVEREQRAAQHPGYCQCELCDGRAAYADSQRDER